MSRYFPNTYEDFKPGSSVEIDNGQIISSIEEYVKSIFKRVQPTRKFVDGGLYVGVTGVAYVFHYLAKNAVSPESKEMYLEKSMEYIKPALMVSSGHKTSFLVGDAGSYAVAAAIYHNAKDSQLSEQYLQKYKSLCTAYLDPKFLKCGGDELFVGRTGYLAGALWLTRELDSPVVPVEKLYTICDVMVTSGHDYAKAHRSPCPLMYAYYNTEYLGAAHGLSSILQMLLTVPGYLEYNRDAAKDIKASVDFVLTIQTQEGNWPSCMEDLGLAEHKLVHWCHGAPGVVYLMAKAFLTYKEQKYLDSCVKVADLVWEKGLLKKGPGICHGVAGNAHVFLLLYRLTGDQKYLYRANVFADFMRTSEFLSNARVPDNPLTLYEGIAGTVCFLADLLSPNKAEFPFQDVFSTYS